MGLLRETSLAVGWTARVVRVLLRTCPWMTPAVILMIAVSSIANLLAFFLPLKVVLLAGSDGVPRYFRFFIEPDQKLGWIVALSAGAVAFYALALVSISVSKRLAERGSAVVLQAANELAVAGRQREEAQDYYARFSGIVSNVLVAIIGLAALVVVHPLLLAVVMALLLLEYLATAGVVRRANGLDPGRVHRMVRRVHRMVRDNLPDYLRVLSSTNFLVGFFVILVPFLFGTSGNILLAILSMLILRQCFTALSSAVRDLAGLWAKRARVDPVVFRERQVGDSQRTRASDVQQVLAKARRERATAEALVRAGHQVEELESEWLDPPIRGILTFRLRAVLRPDGRRRYLQQRLFYGEERGQIEHEAYLFTHISREILMAPEALARFDMEPFAVQVSAYGTGRPLRAAAWRQTRFGLLAHNWGVEVPAGLVTAYGTSHKSLPARLTTSLLEPIAVALDRPSDAELFERFVSNLPQLRQRLARVPLYVHNPDLTRLNVAVTRAGEPLVIHWGHWALEPIGVSLPSTISEAELEAGLDSVHRVRSVAREDLSVPSVLLTRDCRALERSIRNGNYRAAIQCMATILNAAACPTADQATRRRGSAVA